MVDDHGQVFVAALVGDLVDTDPPQPGEGVDRGSGLIPDPGDDRADRAPGDPHQLHDRSLGALCRQPGDLLVEGVGVTGTVAGPRNLGDHHPVLATADTRRVGLEEDHHLTEVQTAPSAPSRALVIPDRPALTPAAPCRGPRCRPDMRDQPHRPIEILLELNVFDHRLLDPEESSP